MWSNLKVCQYWSIADVPTELSITRTRWIQSLIRFLKENGQVLAAIFGDTVLEQQQENFTPTMDAHGFLSPNCNPWAKLLFTDVQKLFEASQTDMVWDGSFKKLFSPEYADFVDLDPSCIRAQFLSVSVPENGVSTSDGHEVPVVLESADQGFVCHCGVSFSSNRALKTHQRKKHLTHQPQSVLYTSVVTNQCPVCSMVLADRLTAQHHLVNAVRTKRCRPNLNKFHHPLIVPTELKCPFQLCSESFSQLKHLQTHIVFVHLPVHQGHQVVLPDGPLGIEEAHGLR